jgi:hypothetical protein
VKPSLRDILFEFFFYLGDGAYKLNKKINFLLIVYDSVSFLLNCTCARVCVKIKFM